MASLIGKVLTTVLGDTVMGKINQNKQGLIEATMKGMNSTKNIPQPITVGGE